MGQSFFLSILCKVQLTEEADKILTDKLEDRTYSYYANSDDEPSSILTNLIFLMS